jgi:hypothetical protein
MDLAVQFSRAGGSPPGDSSSWDRTAQTDIKYNRSERLLLSTRCVPQNWPAGVRTPTCSLCSPHQSPSAAEPGIQYPSKAPAHNPPSVQSFIQSADMTEHLLCAGPAGMAVSRMGGPGRTHLLSCTPAGLTAGAGPTAWIQLTGFCTRDLRKPPSFPASLAAVQNPQEA